MLNRIKNKLKLYFKFYKINKIKFQNYSEYKDYFLKEDKISTWDSSAFLQIIEKNLKNKNNLILVEIGVARGSTSKFTIEKLSNKISTYYGIDPYLSNYDFADGFSYYNQDLMDNLYKYVIEKVNDHRFNLIRKKSNLAYHDFEDDSIDAIYIDGNHKYKDVLEDIKNWYPKIKKNGVIVGDDFLTFSGVERAVTEFFQEFENSGNTWFVIK